MVPYPAYPEGQADRQGASADEQLGHEKVMEAKSAPSSIAFGTLLMPSLRYTK